MSDEKNLTEDQLNNVSGGADSAYEKEKTWNIYDQNKKSDYEEDSDRTLFKKNKSWIF